MRRLRRRRSPRALAVLSVVLVLAPALKGCSDPTTPAERPTIGLVVQGTRLGFARELTEGFHGGAQLAGGVEAEVTGPPTYDVPAQTELFHEMTTVSQRGVAVSLSAPEKFALPVADVVNRGIPVITVAGKPAPGSGVRLCIGNDNYELGRMLADEAIKRLPPGSRGKVVLGSSVPALPGLDERARGMRERFAQKLPHVRVIGPFDTQNEPSVNRAAWQLLVDANPDAAAFLATGDMDAVNLAGIRADTRGGWLAAGYSVDPDALRGVRDGQLFALVSPEHFLKGVGAAWLLAEHAKGARPLPEGWISTPGLVVDAANVDAIMRRQESQASKLAWFRPQIEKLVTRREPGPLPPCQAR